MGMYTELDFNSELRKDTPEQVIDTLKYMVGDIEEKPKYLPDHELFSKKRWDYMLRTDSYYFDADTKSTLRFDDISETYYLNIRCNLKNYDDEIGSFIDWIMPYVKEYKREGDFLGFYRYEEDEDPTIIRVEELKGGKE